MDASTIKRITITQDARDFGDGHTFMCIELYGGKDVKHVTSSEDRNGNQDIRIGTERCMHFLKRVLDGEFDAEFDLQPKQDGDAKV